MSDVVCKKIAIVVAATPTGVIGNSQINSMPWPKIKEDMKFFRTLTTGNTVIMGRRTFDSIRRPLPNRQNIVITRQSMHIDGCIIASSLAEAVTLANGPKVFIIGGGEIYKQSLPLVEEIYFTRIKKEYPGDVKFVLAELSKDYWLTRTLYEDDSIVIEHLQRM